MNDAKITISCPQGGTEEPYISIQIIDCNSRMQFVELKISPENFAMAVTGQARMDCKLKTRGLEKVGMVQQTKSLSFLLPKHNYANRYKIARQEALRLVPEGWTPTSHYEAQDFFTGNGKTTCTTCMTRWVDEKTNDLEYKKMLKDFTL